MPSTNPPRRLATALAAATVLCLSVTFAQSADATTGAREFKNCTALNKVYPHGVGKVGAHDKTSGTPVTNFKRSKALYNANKKSDGDGDKIACEKA